MDRFERRRYGFDERGIRPDAIIAFLVGVLVAWVVAIRVLNIRSGLFFTLIVIAVGGLWYHWRRVV